LSSGLKISYGKFDYYVGGDIFGRIPLGTPEWYNMETPVADALGPIEAMSANHHGWIDAMNDYFVRKTQAKVFVLQVNHITHLNFNSMNSMSSEILYPGERFIVPTAIPQKAIDFIGPDLAAKLSGSGGHVVIR